MNASTESNTRFYRGVLVIESESTPAQTLIDIRPASQFRSFVGHVERGDTVWTAWARPIDDGLRRQIEALPAEGSVLDLLLDDKYRVSLASESQVPNESRGRDFLGEYVDLLPREARPPRHLLLLGDDDNPVSVFTLDVASASPKASLLTNTFPPDDELIFHMRFEDDAGAHPSMPLAVDELITVQVALSLPGEEGLNVDKGSVRDLFGREVRFHLEGIDGLQFQGRSEWSPKTQSGWIRVERDQELPFFWAQMKAAQSGKSEVRAHLEVRTAVPNTDQHQVERVRFGDHDYLSQIVKVESGSAQPANEPLIGIQANGIALPNPPQLSIKNQGGRLHLSIDGEPAIELKVTVAQLQHDSGWPEKRADLRNSVSRKYFFGASGEPLDADEECRQLHLLKLAEIGTWLYQGLFQGIELEGLRTRLRGIVGHLVVDDFGARLPWELFYDGPKPTTGWEDPAGANEIDVSGFWAYRFRMTHGVQGGATDPSEVIDPYRRTKAWVHPEVGSTQQHAASVSVSDSQVVTMNRELISKHFGVGLDGEGTTIDSPAQLSRWLTEPPATDQSTELVYLLGHGNGASSKTDRGAPSGTPPDQQTWLNLGGESVWMTSVGNALADVEMAADSMSRGAWKNPIVIVNACESLAPDPVFENAFITALYGEGGASAVIGPIAEIHPLFATRFVDEVLKRFMAGDEQIGESIHETTRALLDRGNPYGLLYTIYGHSHITCKGQTQ